MAKVQSSCPWIEKSQWSFADKCSQSHGLDRPSSKNSQGSSRGGGSFESDSHRRSCRCPAATRRGPLINCRSTDPTEHTALVAHLTSQTSDGLGDLSLVPTSSSTRGVQKRERMQNDLATGVSCYTTCRSCNNFIGGSLHRSQSRRQKQI